MITVAMIVMGAVGLAAGVILYSLWIAERRRRQGA